MPCENLYRLMTALEKYGWWGSGSKEPPAHLKTKKQLSKLGLMTQIPCPKQNPGLALKVVSSS